MNRKEKDRTVEGKDRFFMDIDRMTNEGLAGGYVTDEDNGEIDAAVEIESESEPTLKTQK